MSWVEKFIQHCLGLVLLFTIVFQWFLLDRKDCRNRRDHGSLSQNGPQMFVDSFMTFRKKTLLHMVRRAHSSCAPNSIHTRTVSDTLNNLNSSSCCWYSQTKKKKKMFPIPFSSEYNMLARIKYKQGWRMKYFLSSLHPLSMKTKFRAMQNYFSGASVLPVSILMLWGPCFSDICLTVIGLVRSLSSKFKIYMLRIQNT